MYYDNNSVTAPPTVKSVDARMSRLCNSIKQGEQSAQDQQQYILEEMEYILSQNPEREDIAACIEDIKTKIKHDESEHWNIANGWMEHFDGTTAVAPESDPEPDGDEDDEPDTGNDSD